ncbi:hypothetical protein TcCL_Unassigned00085 [Trypanosoma cruzi]|nr:hypothetical protein TcCL_Unassigned00085 [Trypanosoma cruzi]
MREEHHGKNAQKLIRKPPTHSTSINGVASYICSTTRLAGASPRGLQYTSHVITVKKKQRPQSGCHPAAEIKAQPKKCRKSSHIPHKPSAAYAPNAQHGRRAMLTIIQHTDTERVGGSSTRATSSNDRRARGCCTQSHPL